MKVVLMNVVFYSFLGLTAYFVTPHVLWVLAFIQGYTETKETKTLKGVETLDAIKEVMND